MVSVPMTHWESERELEKRNGVVGREGRRVWVLLRKAEVHLVDCDRVDHVEVHGGLRETG